MTEGKAVAFQGTVAALFGLNEAILLQKLFELMEQPSFNNEALEANRDNTGRIWVCVPPYVFKELLPSISDSTRKRALRHCKELGILLIQKSTVAGHANFYHVVQAEIQRLASKEGTNGR